MLLLNTVFKKKKVCRHCENVGQWISIRTIKSQLRSASTSPCWKIRIKHTSTWLFFLGNSICDLRPRLKTPGLLRKKWPQLDASEVSLLHWLSTPPAQLSEPCRHQDPSSHGTPGEEVAGITCSKTQLSFFLIPLNRMKFCKSSTSLKYFPMFETYPQSISYFTPHWLFITFYLWLIKSSFLTWSPY